MSDDGWATVAKKKPQRKNSQRQHEFKQLQELRIEHPHILDRSTAQDIAIHRNIDGFVDKMMSEEWIRVQAQGWKYVGIYTPSQQNKIPDDPTYMTMDLENGWGDVVVFKRLSY